MSEYPSLHDAILGNEHAANLYCAIKYVIWHTVYLLLTAFMLTLTVTMLPLEWVWSRDSVRGAIVAVVSSSRVKQAAKALVLLTAIVIVGGVLVAVALNFYMALFFIASYAAVFALGWVWLVHVVPFLERVLPNVRERSQRQPVARRVYGYCPVSFEIEPRWYERLKERLL